jgi:hypothetical protein
MDLVAHIQFILDTIGYIKKLQEKFPNGKATFQADESVPTEVFTTLGLQKQSRDDYIHFYKYKQDKWVHQPKHKQKSNDHDEENQILVITFVFERKRGSSEMIVFDIKEQNITWYAHALVTIKVDSEDTKLDKAFRKKAKKVHKLRNVGNDDVGETGDTSCFAVNVRTRYNRYAIYDRKDVRKMLLLDANTVIQDITDKTLLMFEDLEIDYMDMQCYFTKGGAVLQQTACYLGTSIDVQNWNLMGDAKSIIIIHNDVLNYILKWCRFLKQIEEDEEEDVKSINMVMFIRYQETTTNSIIVEKLYFTPHTNNEEFNPQDYSNILSVKRFQTENEDEKQPQADQKQQSQVDQKQQSQADQKQQSHYVPGGTWIMYPVPWNRDAQNRDLQNQDDNQPSHTVLNIFNSSLFLKCVMTWSEAKKMNEKDGIINLTGDPELNDHEMYLFIYFIFNMDNNGTKLNNPGLLAVMEITQE